MSVSSPAFHSSRFRLRCRLWLRGFLIAGMFLLGVAAVAAVMPALRLLPGRRSTRWHEAIVLRWNRAVCRVLNLRLHVSGKPDPGARLLVANHISWLDIIALGSQRPCLFVAKEEVADWPVMGYLAKGIGTLFVRRGDAGQTAATAERMAWLLRQGKCLMLFPEGTTTTGQRVLRFHSKLFHPAQLANASVQAIALRYEGGAKQYAPFIGEEEFLPHLLNVLALDRIDLHLHYAQALPAGLHRSETAAAAHRQVAEALASAMASRYFRAERRVMHS
jgi:1-acyl-sn-glycerol-3-phosphate acyltransferase